ncbi:hypothetical protein FRB96_008703 [Tulasnella sp. 330]|nr:hypothetical protein FRB96_008703 [Tulasnella sp. 330]KAG8881775.1 hypothetical protein FRB97_009110 [Tulasnella sp. 331]KAG8887770.1 hypothetical protein FRB98_009030 [Tulasnella sp. 332]
MVFADITPADKEAFFLLLDEGSIAAIAAGKSPGGQAAIKNLGSTAGAHLKSRAGFGGPNMFGGSTSASSTATGSPAANQEAGTDESSKSSFSALRGAFANATPMASSMLGGSKKAPPPPPPSVKYQSRPPISVAAEDPQDGEEEEDAPPLRVTPPAAPLRSSPSTAGNISKFAPSGLVSGKHFGGGKLDLTNKNTLMSSTFGGLRNRGPAAPSAPTPTSPTTATPPPPSRSFAPPPIRRVPSSTPSARTPEPEPEPEQEGEWAQALYDYTSDDKADLHFTEGQTVRIIAHTSDDWWTGEVDGKEGLFPSTYVKLM